MYEEPVVGAFYEDEEGRMFEVISFDENDGTIEIRYEDRTPDEIDLDDWYGMDLERLETDENGDDDAHEEEDDGVSDDDADLDGEDEDDFEDEEE